MHDQELKRRFERRNLRDEPGRRMNEAIWHVFQRIYNADDFEKAYILAEELNAITQAVRGLDGHIVNLMHRIEKIEEVRKDGQ